MVIPVCQHMGCKCYETHIIMCYGDTLYKLSLWLCFRLYLLTLDALIYVSRVTVWESRPHKFPVSTYLYLLSYFQSSPVSSLSMFAFSQLGLVGSYDLDITCCTK